MTRRIDWGSLCFDSWMLGVSSSAVIGLRCMKLATGDSSAMTEANLMVAEKMEAAVALQLKALSGGLGSTPQMAASRSIAHYRAAVEKNRRRLSR